MAIPDSTKIYPRSEDKQIVYLKNVITNPNIEVGDFTFYILIQLEHWGCNIFYHFALLNL